MKLMRYLSLAVLAALLGLGSAISSVGEGSLAQAQECTVTLRPGESIQAAIDQAQAGAVICLQAGTWKENIRIAKSLTLRGVGQDGQGRWLTWVKGAQSGKPVLRLESDSRIEVVIEDLAVAEAKPFRSNEFCRARDPQWICPDGIQVWSLVRATIRNVRISNNAFVGLLLLGSAQATVAGTTISGNRFGIDMSSSAQAQITTTWIFDNGFYGIEILDTAQATISHTTIESNGTRCANYICNGITVFDKVRLEVRDSRIVRNTHWGVAAALIKCGYSANAFTGQVMLVNNTIKDNRRGQVCLP